MSRHVFTPEERRRGGKTRASQPSFREHCARAYEALQAKYGAASLYILRAYIQPYYEQKKGNNRNGT